MADIWQSIGDLLGLNKGKGTIDAASRNRDVLKELERRMGGIIDSGDAQARGYLTDSRDLASLGPNANGILGDIYGLNGAAGNDKVRGMFQTNPGYEFQMDQGLTALDRRNAAAGRFSSGNADTDALKFSHGLADQSWGDWVSGITSGIDRSIRTNGDLATLTGSTTGQRLGLAGDIGSGYLNANNQQAAGQEAGQGAIWDLFGNVAGVAGSAFGLNKNGMPGGGGGVPATPTGAGFGGYGRGY